MQPKRIKVCKIFVRKDCIALHVVDEWKAAHREVSYLGIPEYITSGNHTSGSVDYRFMVMQRFGKDLEKIFTECGRRFSMPTVCYLAIRVVSMCMCVCVHACVRGCMHVCVYIHACVYALTKDKGYFGI